MTESFPVLFDVDGPIAHLRLNRPEAGNAVDETMFSLILEHLNTVQQRSELRVLVLSGAGENFCLGRDRQPPKGTPTALIARQGLRRIVQLNTALANLPIPTIAAVQGKAAGMGAGISVHCNLTVAAETATISFPEIHHDLPPTIVLSYLPAYLPPKRCFELVVTGNALDSGTALAWGLINRVVPESEVLSVAMSMARDIASHSGLALRTIKEYLLSRPGMNTSQAYDLGINMLANVTTSGEIGLYDKR